MSLQQQPQLLRLFFLLITFSHFGKAQTDDRVICNRTFSFAFEHKLIEKPIGDVVTEIGKQFLNFPYEPNTLEHSDSEQLVVNLHSFDCVTFVENIAAIARCIKKNRLSFDEYQRQLQLIRYRNGIANGYASRLHYFSDWIAENVRKGIVRNTTQELGGQVYQKKINFMTSHRDKYKQLNNDSVFSSLKTIEDSLSSVRMYVISKSQIRSCQSKIRNGSIIAILSSQQGLDVAHTGIAIRLEDGSLHYLHAPNVKGNVKISNESLEEYVQRHSRFTGIIVAEVNEPVE